jgi:hypothetical protein
MREDRSVLNEQLDVLAASCNLFRGCDLPAIWADEQVTPLDHLGGARSWPELVDRVSRCILPPHVVPLGLDRRPFAGLSRETVARVAARALLEPERKGRLTDSVRRTIGFERTAPADFIVAEAHVDATAVDRPLVEELIGLGFETDNFFRIEPAQYKYHFTTQLVLHRSREQNNHRYREILRASERASELLDEFNGGYAYVETEWYESGTSRTYEYRPVAPGGVDEFPFDERTFRRVEVPNTEDDARKTGIELGQKRAADIHVKIPSYIGRCDYDTADADSAHALKSRLVRSGFYEIVSEGGNFLYSAHFAHMRESRLAFAQLDDFARRHGGITGLYCETCTRMWRKRVTKGSEWFLAEVPPHLFFCDPPALAAAHR